MNNHYKKWRLWSATPVPIKLLVYFSKTHSTIRSEMVCGMCLLHLVWDSIVIMLFQIIFPTIVVKAIVIILLIIAWKLTKYLLHTKYNLGITISFIHSFPSLRYAPSAFGIFFIKYILIMKVLDILTSHSTTIKNNCWAEVNWVPPNCRGLNSLPVILGGWNQLTAWTFPFIRAFQDILLMFCDTRNADFVIWSSLRCYSMVFTYPITYWWLGIVTKTPQNLVC